MIEVCGTRLSIGSVGEVNDTDWCVDFLVMEGFTQTQIQYKQMVTMVELFPLINQEPLYSSIQPLSLKRKINILL